MSDDRIGFIERLGRLAGQTTYRVPVEGVGTRFSHLPESHALAAALSYARGQRWNPGPELAYAVATGIPHKRDCVIDWLAEKLHVGTGAEGRNHADRIRGIAAISYSIVVRGPESIIRYQFDPHILRLANVGAAWLSACLDDTIARAERQAGECRSSSPTDTPETA